MIWLLIPITSAVILSMGKNNSVGVGGSCPFLRACQPMWLATGLSKNNAPCHLSRRPIWELLPWIPHESSGRNKTHQMRSKSHLVSGFQTSKFSWRHSNRRSPEGCHARSLRAIDAELTSTAESETRVFSQLVILTVSVAVLSRLAAVLLVV